MRQGMFVKMLVASPVGAIELTSDGAALCAVHMLGQTPSASIAGSADGEDAVLVLAATQLAEYFAGTRQDFELPLRQDGTEFQRRVWAALRTIPFGESWSYLMLARAVGLANGSRAVGSANRVNPLGIVVPCHRVIGSNGTLTGYAGGLGNKKWLLEHEAGIAGRTFALRG